MRRVKFPPVATDGRLIVVVTDGKHDTILERTTDMPTGAWGVVPLPASGKRPRRRRSSLLTK